MTLAGAFVLAVVSVLVIAWWKGRRARQRVGLSAATPMVVRLDQATATGPARRAWARGAAAGDLGSVAPHVGVQRLLWAVLGFFFNGGGRLGKYVGAHGIVVFVGPNGSGKSLMAVESMLPTLDGIAWECADLDHKHNAPVRSHVDSCYGCTRVIGEEVLCEEAAVLLTLHGRGLRLAWSTLPLLDRDGRVHPLYRPLASARELPHIEHADVLFDEVAGVSDADTSASMPSAIKRWLQQLRKRDVRLRVTTPAYDRCSLPIRQIANVVVDCRSFFVASGGGRVWKPRRAMIFEAYDAFEFGHFDKNSGKRLKREAVMYYWRNSHRGMGAYSTLAQVSALVDVDESGACVVCNGSRPRVACACPPDAHEIPPSELEVVEIPGPRGGRARQARRRVPVADAAGPRRGAASDAGTVPVAPVPPPA